MCVFIICNYLTQAMEVNGYGSYAFDAVLTFGLALNNLILDDPSSVESINRVETLR